MSVASMKTLSRFFLSCLIPPFLLAACGGGGGGAAASGPVPGSGTLVLEATDAPIDPRLIESAILWVDEIRIHREADGDSGFVTLYDGNPREVELTTLRNGLTRALASGILESGSYGQLRLHCSDAYLRLKNGREYSTQEDTIRLTSQDTSGFKIFFDPPVVIEEDVQTEVLLDFDVPKTFSPVPGNDIENARFFHLHPLVRTGVVSSSGELRGVVTTMDDSGNLAAAPHAAVYVLPPGETDPIHAVASTLSDANGGAAILAVPPGTYDLLALLGERQGRADGLVVTAGHVTPFEIHVE